MNVACLKGLTMKFICSVMTVNLMAPGLMPKGSSGVFLSILHTPVLCARVRLCFARVCVCALRVCASVLCARVRLCFTRVCVCSARVCASVLCACVRLCFARVCVCSARVCTSVLRACVRLCCARVCVCTVRVCVCTVRVCVCTLRVCASVLRACVHYACVHTCYFLWQWRNNLLELIVAYLSLSLSPFTYLCICLCMCIIVPSCTLFIFMPYRLIYLFFFISSFIFPIIFLHISLFSSIYLSTSFCLPNRSKSEFQRYKLFTLFTSKITTSDKFTLNIIFSFVSSTRLLCIFSLVCELASLIFLPQKTYFFLLSGF